MSAGPGRTYWMVAVPNDGTGSRGIKHTVRRITDSIHINGRKLAELSYIPRPALKVGTLDALIVLSDALVRVDSFVEGIVRKVERQYAESEASITEGKRGEGEAKAGLAINGKTVPEYLRKFRWDVERHDPADQLPAALSARFQKLVEKADRDVRSYIHAYNEKKAALLNLQRKAGGNLTVASLDTIITPEVVARGL